MGKIIKDTIHANGIDIGIYTQDFENEFISLTDIARYKSDDPTAVIQNWMRNRDVIEFLGLWERLHNPDFKPLEFEGFKKQAGANAFTMSPKKWIEATDAIGIVSKAGRYGVMSEDMEAKVWEKRMPDLAPAEQLAVEIDRFTHDYDETLYHDSTRNMTENVSELQKLIQQGDMERLSTWLNQVISEGVVSNEVERVKELLEKLAEYKPLAKIEEMEEQNYNMIDNVLNNGAEKEQREANKKEQEQPMEKVSLKARLAEKKAQVAGHGREHEAQENTKNGQREM